MKHAEKCLALLLCAVLLCTLLPCAPRAAAMQVYDIEPGAATAVTIETPGENMYFRFVPAETGVYRFFSQANPADVEAELFDAGMNRLAQDDDCGAGLNFRIDWELTAGETYYYAARYRDNTETGSFGVKLVKITDFGFTAGGKNGRTGFRAAAGDTVTLEAEAASAMGRELRYSWFASYHYDYSKLLPETSPVLTVENVTGDATYFCCVEDEYGSYGEILFSVFCFTDTPIAADVETAVEITADNRSVYFSFTPEETAYYRFFSQTTADTEAYMYDGDMNEMVYDDDSGPAYNFRIDADLTAGETYYYKARYRDSTRTGSFNVKLVKITDRSFYARAKNGKSVFVASAGESVTLETEAASGMGEVRYGWYREKNGSRTPLAGTSAALTLENVTETADYICSVQDDYGSYEDVRFAVFCFDAQPISLCTETTATVTAPGETVYFRFQPETTGLYRFYSFTEQDVEGRLFGGDMTFITDNDDNGPGYNFMIDWDLTAGETYYCAARFRSSGQTGSFSVYLAQLQENGFSAARVTDEFAFVRPGDTPTFEVTAACTQGALHYLWQEHAKHSWLNGANGPSCTVPAVTKGTVYECFIADNYGNVASLMFEAVNLDAITYTWEENYAACTAVYGDTNPAMIEYVEPSVRTTATCEAPGATVYTAEFINPRFETQTAQEETPALGHAYGEPVYEWSEDNKTCTAKVICANDESHVISETATTERQVLAEPTCTEPGRALYTAAFSNKRFSGQQKEAEIPALGHDIIEHKAQAPTCSAVGWDAYRTCSRCDYSTYTELPADPSLHDFSVTVYPATCTEGGYTGYVCKNCGYSYTADETGPLGHKYGEPVYEWRRDYKVCTATVVCENDPSHVITETAESEITDQLLPTCTKPGYTVYAVGFINKIFFGQQKKVDVPALGHDIIEHEGQAPTCSAAGWAPYRTCSRCDYTTYKELPRDPDAHDFNVTVYPPTCTDPGYTSYACKYCRYGYSTDETEPLGHAYGDPVYEWSKDYKTCTAMVICANDASHVLGEEAKTTVTEVELPTCTEPGYVVYVAAFNNKRFYGQTQKVMLPALGHDFTVEAADGAHLAAPATCVAAAAYYYGCSRCEAVSDTLTFTVGLPDAENGHDWGEWTVTVPAAPGTPGEERRVCRNDPTHVETREIPALPGYARGDVDNDTEITAGDARLALRAAVGLEPEWDKNPEDPRYLAANADGEGGVTAADARLILRVAVHLEEF